MADISIVQDDCLDDSDEGVYEQGDGPSGGDIGDDGLLPLQRIKKYVESENVYNRQMVPTVLQDLFNVAPVDALTADLPQIMDIVAKVADEDDMMVRKVIIDQITQVARIAADNSVRVPALSNIVSEYLLPMVVRNLGNSESHLRKTAHSTLFSLLDSGVVSKAQAEIQVCPTVLALSRNECLMYYHTGAVSLMSKMVPLLGRDVTERVFLDRFSELCSNEMFYVRKVCASHFGDFCAVVGKPAFLKILLPAFIKLCGDEIWGVKKACADVAMFVSSVCDAPTRTNIIAPLFIKLLQDDCRWVRISAFQTLGPFITTFAEPSITSLAYNNMGELVLVNADGNEFKIDSSTQPTDEVIHLFYLSLDDLNNTSEIGDDYFDDLDKKKKLKHGFDGILPMDVEKKGDGDASEDSTLNLPVEDVGDHYLEDYMHTKEKKAENVDVPMNTDVDFKAEEDGVDTEINLKECKEDVCSSTTKEVSLNSESDDSTGDKENKVGNNLENEIVNFATKEESKRTNLPCDELDIDSDILNVVYDKMADSWSIKADDNSVDGNKQPSNEGKDEENWDLYNSYNYWYVPPDMPLDPGIVDAQKKTSNQETAINIDLQNPQISSNSETPAPLNQTAVLDHTFNVVAPEAESKEEVVAEVKEPPQHIVPQLLIDHFISMADPSMAQKTDDSIAYHCAYSLPAVALTLGSNNWHLLKDTCETLGADMQYKVRRTVASSLHELAVILGPEMASNNLTHLFNGFIKDLDEVRIGLLKHLAHFLRLISPPKRIFYLPRLSYFLQNNPELNWRFRHELAEQLLLAVNLFPPGEASKQISSIAQRLLCDKVSAVRQVALQLVAELLRHISSEPGLTPRLLVKFAETFAHSKKWKLRQTFVLLSAELLRLNALPPEQFATEVMPHLLDLSWDPVANVRLVVGRTIAMHMITNEYFLDPENQRYDSLETVLRRLQTDKDRDVRQSAQTDVPTNHCTN